jgi:hypothetical protein
MNPVNGESKATTKKAPNSLVDDLDILSYSFPMDSEAYIQGLASLMKAATKDLGELEDRRRKLLEATAKAEEEIAAKKESIAAISELWKRTPFADKPIGETKPLLKEKSFTKAIIYVLRTSNERLLPTDIRDRMADWGFDLESYKSDVVASIHTTLRRLHKQDKVKEFSEGHRRNSYEWKKGKDRLPLSPLGVS